MLLISEYGISNGDEQSEELTFFGPRYCCNVIDSTYFNNRAADHRKCETTRFITQSLEELSSKILSKSI